MCICSPFTRHGQNGRWMALPCFRQRTLTALVLAAVRGGINSLMAEVLEDHVRLHLLQDGHAPMTPDLGEELIDLVRAYLK